MLYIANFILIKVCFVHKSHHVMGLDSMLFLLFVSQQNAQWENIYKRYSNMKMMNKWKSHSSEMKEDVGMSCHEKEREQEQDRKSSVVGHLLTFAFCKMGMV